MKSQRSYRGAARQLTDQSGMTLGAGSGAFAHALLRVPPDAVHRARDPTYEGPAWVTCPNDAVRPGASATSSTTATSTSCVYAEELGFDGVCVNEHHQNAYGNMPSPEPDRRRSSPARRARVKIAVIGNALPLYNPPTRVAEEFAMIDVISGGRLIAGHGRRRRARVLLASRSTRRTPGSGSRRRTTSS